MFYSLVLAFSVIKDNITFETQFVFFSNFRDALTSDTKFQPALIESLKDLVNIPIVIIFSLFVATLLNRNIRGQGFFRAMFVLPILIGTGSVMAAIEGNQSQVAISMGAQAAQSGGASFQDIVLNEQLTTLFGGALSDTIGTIINRISSVMWISGVQIIIFLGVLQTIPAQLYEASVVDGASEFDKLWKITLPLTMPAILLNTVYTLIDSFTSRNNAVISYIADVTFGDTMMLSYGSALSWIYFVVVSIVLALVFLFMRKRTFYMG